VSDDVRVLNWFLGACCIILGAGLGAIDVVRTFNINSHQAMGLLVLALMTGWIVANILGIRATLHDVFEDVRQQVRSSE
jgi:hypothetical protein